MISDYVVARGRIVKVAGVLDKKVYDTNGNIYPEEVVCEVPLTKEVFEVNGYEPKCEVGGIVYVKDFKNGGDIHARFDGGCLYPKVSVRRGMSIFIGEVHSWAALCEILKSCGFEEDFRCV